MNKKGFTLVELLAVIAIIGILSLIAVPNVINVVENTRKQNMLDDAKKLISLAKNEVNSNYELRNFMDANRCNVSTNTCTLNFDSLNEKGDIQNDPDGGTYRNSYVEYKKENNIINYCIHLEGEKRVIGENSTCIDENDLFSKNNVVNK